jgi:restriction system protein
MARINGFEPLLTCDLANQDPSMRIQQSAHYAFSSDLILIFIKLNNNERRTYYKDFDIDEISFRIAVELQDSLAGTFSLSQWQKTVFNKFKELGLYELNLPKNKAVLKSSFDRTCEEIYAGQYLPKASTPYSDEIFNIPYIERVSLYIPYVIEELLVKNRKFTFDQFLLKIAEFVENGTRSILKDILEDGENSIHGLLNLYAEPLEGGLYFTKRPIPEIPSNIANVLELDPYEFEAFAAKLLELEGYKNVVVSGRSGDRGVDIRCNDKNGDLVIVQCKRYTKSNIGSTPIQRLHSFALTRGAKRKICITTTDFTKDGYDEARIANVELISRDGLETLVHKHKMFE